MCTIVYVSYVVYEKASQPRRLLVRSWRVEIPEECGRRAWKGSWMRRLDKTSLVIIAVVVLAIVAATFAFLQTLWYSFRALSVKDLLVLLAMFALVFGLDFVQVTIPRVKFKTQFTVAGTVYIAATIGYNAAIGVMLALIGTLLVEVVARRELKKLIFNVAQHVCMCGTAGVVYQAIVGGTPVVPLATTRTVVAAIIASCLYLVLNNVLFSFVVGIDIGKSPLDVFIANAPGQLLQNITLPSIGLLLTTIRDLSPLSLLIALLPLLGPYIAIRGYRDTQVQMRQSIELLADAMDRRDPATAQHSERVALYVQRIIDELGTIKFADADAIVTAARVHDVGKVGIPDAILLKAGPLTQGEFAVVQTHPTEGFRILEKLPMYREGLGAVRHHHERWDGRGYPDGVQGEDIPLGARIIAVADAFDVMTTERPYAHARTPRQACEELERCKGSHFDPIIVDAFVAAWRRQPLPDGTKLVAAPLPS